MTKGLVTCKKCGNAFIYEKHDGVCPKCCRFYSTTRYNEEEALLKNILAPADEEKCSYHGGHDRSAGLSGHSEMLHSADGNTYQRQNTGVTQNAYQRQSTGATQNVYQRQNVSATQNAYQRQNVSTAQNIRSTYQSPSRNAANSQNGVSARTKVGIIWLVIVIISILIQALASGGH